MINAVIPARAGSQRIISKNVRRLGKHPLLAYSIEACRQSTMIDRIIVSTDSEEIAKIARSYGAETPFLRPEKFAKNDSPDLDFLIHFFENVPGAEVALIRPTSPLRDPKFLDESIAEFFAIEDPDITGFRTMFLSNHPPYKMFKLNEGICEGFFDSFDGVIDYSNLPGQIFPKTYIPNGYIDIVKRRTLLLGSSFGNRIYGKISPEILDIDTEFDFFLAELQIKTKVDKLSDTLDRRKHEK